MARDRLDTLPPGELELERVEQFEREIKRVGENDARLARLADLMTWREYERRRDAAE